MFGFLRMRPLMIPHSTPTRACGGGATTATPVRTMLLPAAAAPWERMYFDLNAHTMTLSYASFPTDEPVGCLDLRLSTVAPCLPPNSPGVAPPSNTNTNTAATPTNSTMLLSPALPFTNPLAADEVGSRRFSLTVQGGRAFQFEAETSAICHDWVSSIGSLLTPPPSPAVSPLLLSGEQEHPSLENGLQSGRAGTPRRRKSVRFQLPSAPDDDVGPASQPVVMTSIDEEPNSVLDSFPNKTPPRLRLRHRKQIKFEAQMKALALALAAGPPPPQVTSLSAASETPSISPHPAFHMPTADINKPPPLLTIPSKAAGPHHTNESESFLQQHPSPTEENPPEVHVPSRDWTPAPPLSPQPMFIMDYSQL